MKTLLPRFTVLSAISAFLLAGCASSTDPDPPPPAEPTETESSPDGGIPTQTAGAPSPPETPTTTDDPGASIEQGGDIDEQDGVRTNAFNAVPDELGEMRVTSSETNPSEHRAMLDYMAIDEQSRMLLTAYIPGNEDDGYTPVSSNADAGFRTAVDGGQRFLGEEGLDVIARSAATDGYDWECFEALKAQEGDIDLTLCATTEYGRVIEVQRLAMHEPDEQVRNDHMDVLLEDVSAALADIGS